MLHLSYTQYKLEGTRENAYLSQANFYKIEILTYFREFVGYSK